MRRGTKTRFRKSTKKVNGEEGRKGEEEDEDKRKKRICGGKTFKRR